MLKNVKYLGYLSTDYKFIHNNLAKGFSYS